MEEVRLLFLSFCCQTTLKFKLWIRREPLRYIVTSSSCGWHLTCFSLRRGEEEEEEEERRVAPSPIWCAAPFFRALRSAVRWETVNHDYHRPSNQTDEGRSSSASSSLSTSSIVSLSESYSRNQKLERLLDSPFRRMGPVPEKSYLVNEMPEWAFCFSSSVESWREKKMCSSFELIWQSAKTGVRADGTSRTARQ